MKNEPFDPEDFLNLKDVTPRPEATALPPIISPPVYERGRQAAPRPIPRQAAIEHRAAQPAPQQPIPARSAEQGERRVMEPIVEPPVYARRGEAPRTHVPQADRPQAARNHAQDLYQQAQQRQSQQHNAPQPSAPQRPEPQATAQSKAMEPIVEPPVYARRGDSARAQAPQPAPQEATPIFSRRLAETSGSDARATTRSAPVDEWDHEPLAGAAPSLGAAADDAPVLPPNTRIPDAGAHMRQAPAGQPRLRAVPSPSTAPAQPQLAPDTAQEAPRKVIEPIVEPPVYARASRAPVHHQAPEWAPRPAPQPEPRIDQTRAKQPQAEQSWTEQPRARFVEPAPEDDPFEGTFSRDNDTPLMRMPEPFPEQRVPATVASQHSYAAQPDYRQMEAQQMVAGMAMPAYAPPPPQPVFLERTTVKAHMSDLGGVAVREPLTVVYRGVELRTNEWSVNGFTLDRAIALHQEPGQGRVFDVTLLIGRGITRIEMRVQARPENAGAASADRFLFVDLDRAQAEMLHRIVDHVVAGEALTLTQLLNETEKHRETRATTGERARSLRTGVQLTMAGVVLAAAGAMTWNSFSTVNARYGAVTVGATSLSVPLAGTISVLSAQPGQAVSAGEVLGYVRPADFDRRQQNLTDRRRDLEVEAAELDIRRLAMIELATLSQGGEQTERDRLEQTLELAERRLDLERRQLATMRAGGAGSAQRTVAQQEARVLQAETVMLRARGDVEDLTERETLTGLGITSGQLRGSTETVETVEMRLASVRDELAQMDAIGLDGSLGEPIVSPCDCTIQSLERRSGEWADPQDRLAVLVGNEAPVIHALVLGEEARSIELGDRALVELADGTPIDGRVQRMNYDPHWRGYTGLQDDVFGADRYARVEIVPDRPITAPVGMVGDVSIQTSPLWGSIRAQATHLWNGITGFVGL